MEVCPLAAALLGVLTAGAFVFLLLPLLVEFLVTPTYPAPHPSGGVLVTGASTGIGEDCALTLAKKGFLVFAGVRRAEDGAKLQARHPGVIPVILDVTRPEHIEAALALVRSELASRQLPLVRACGWVVDTDLVGGEGRWTTRPESHAPTCTNSRSPGGPRQQRGVAGLLGARGAPEHGPAPRRLRGTNRTRPWRQRESV